MSNASDACDKLRFEAIDNPALLEGDGELAITVSYDKDARTVTISDNGIGLSREEAVANLGTIARSGTREFFSQLTGDKQKGLYFVLFAYDKGITVMSGIRVFFFYLVNKSITAKQTNVFSFR